MPSAHQRTRVEGGEGGQRHSPPRRVLDWNGETWGEAVHRVCKATEPAGAIAPQADSLATQ